MGISGNLKTMQLAELLQWLSMGQKTGTLRIEKGPPSNVIKRIFFDEGVIISSASTDPGEYLGRFLVSHGYLAEEEINKAIARQKEEQQLLGRILVSMGMIGEDDLNQMLRLKAEEGIYDVFTWGQGAFEFLDDELPSENMVRMELDVQWIVLEGTRRTDEWVRMQELIPSSLCVPVMVADLGVLELEEFERSLLEWVDDDRTVEEISKGSMTNLFQVSEIFAAQVQAGVLKMVKPRVIELPASSQDSLEVDEAPESPESPKTPSMDPNESGAFFLPMMQQMMAQYQQQMMAQSASMMGGPQAVAQQPMAVPQPPAQPAPPAAPTPGVNVGGGRTLNFAGGGGQSMPAAAQPTATLPPTAQPAAAQPVQAANAPTSEAEALLREAENKLQRGALAEALATFRKAKSAEGRGPQIDARVQTGEDKVVSALQSRGVDLNRVPKLKCDMADLATLDISPQEGFMLTRIDGSYDIKSILRMSPMPKPDALLFFWKMRESGHVGL